MVSVSSRAPRALRSVAVAVGIAALAIGTSACTSSSPEAGLTPITLQTSWVPSVQFGGTYLADAKGYYTDNGVEVTILPGGPNVDTLAAVASGQADIAMENADTVARANLNGADLVIVAAGYPKNPLVILSSADNPINTPADMEGKKIGVPTADEAQQDALVQANDLDASKITTVPVGFDVAPLVSGEVDGIWAIYSSQPIAYEAATGKPGVTMLTADYGLDVYTQVYVVSKASLADPGKKAAIESFLTAEIEGWQDFVADPTEAVKITLDTYAKSGGLKLEDQTKQAELQMDLVVTDDTKAHGLFWMSDEGIQKNLTTLASLDIKADESLFDNSLLDDIYQGRSSLE